MHDPQVGRRYCANQPIVPSIFSRVALTGICHPPPSTLAECLLISMRALELRPVSRHRGRGARLARASIAQLPGPVMVSQSKITGTWPEHTVNGRTLIATLIEEAPSVAAMIACAGYASVDVRRIMTRSLKTLVREREQPGL